MRRTWVKLYVDQILRGSMFGELLPDERFIWFGFIVLAGDSPIDGSICLTENMGYSDEQIADLLKVEPDLIKRAKRKFIKFDKIMVFANNVIGICNWKIYQSEYDRQKGYRKRLQGKVTGLQGEVTNSSLSLSPSLIFNILKGEYEGVTENDIAAWAKAYPACDIKAELLRSAEWLKANPTKTKSNYRRFITNWLNRTQDRGGSKTAKTPSDEYHKFLSGGKP